MWWQAPLLQYSTKYRKCQEKQKKYFSQIFQFHLLTFALRCGIIIVQKKKEGIEMIAIIYNSQGLWEHNYLYTDEEIQKYDPELFMSCVNNKGDWIESPLCPCSWKTWEGCYIADDDIASIKQFLEGRWNSDIEEMKAENPDVDYSDWGWNNDELNDLYDGIPSETMKTWLDKLKIAKRN